MLSSRRRRQPGASIGGSTTRESEDPAVPSGVCGILALPNPPLETGRSVSCVPCGDAPGHLQYCMWPSTCMWPQCGRGARGPQSHSMFRCRPSRAASVATSVYRPDPPYPASPASATRYRPPGPPARDDFAPSQAPSSPVPRTPGRRPQLSSTSPPSPIVNGGPGGR